MEQVQHTYKSIIRFYNTGNMWLQMNPGKISKFHHALTRTLKKATDIVGEYNDLLEDLNIEFASVDKDGNILKADDGKEYKYTPRNLTARNKKQRELFLKVVPIDVYYATELPEEFGPMEREMFEGFVIRHTEECEEAVTDDEPMDITVEEGRSVGAM